jgi:hypothetical protein
MGFAVGCSEWDGGGKKGLRPTCGGSGARAWGVPADRRVAPGRQGPKLAGGCDMQRTRAASRKEGEGRG